MANEDGHVLGNFHAYYSFNPVNERLRFMNVATSNAVRQALLALSDGGHSSTTVIDIGCNEGDLTIGLYDELNGRTRHDKHDAGSHIGPTAKGFEDVHTFDVKNMSVLYELMHKQRKKIDFIVKEEGGTNHRKHFSCEIKVDGESLGKGEGVSKQVAKAKAAEAALQFLRARGQASPATTTAAGDASSVDSATTAAAASLAEPRTTPQKDEKQVEPQLIQLKERKKLFVLGVDIDKELIDRANVKSVEVADGDTVQFRHADVSAKSFDDAIHSFLELAKRSPSQRPFDLVTCFSVTMWIHLNHGDDGLWKFLDRVSDMTEHLIVEPQPWKCYRCVLVVAHYSIVFLLCTH